MCVRARALVCTYIYLYVYVCCVCACVSVNQWVTEAKGGGLHALVLLDVALPPPPAPPLRDSYCTSAVVRLPGLSWLSPAILS